ncbi:histidinol-phosphatase HisJ [Bacillus sp. Marseille-P3661]|uniref:histidinol-phosphatase HisJ n=1 Tax=Bacillus sp. Marseille-P3661 TaxID=1936234 RepID=UPI000C82FB1E|nr:histidinol-phosphatase HisJ [Bacillus sp. Marseille-P3661]
MKIDGHIHSPYCPHGTKDTFEQYINRAIELCFKEISFTEHAPLPIEFADPTPDRDSGMEPQLLESYISDLQQLKTKYRNHIKINIGLEVDYLVNYESETTAFLNEYGRFLDDSILSVHFLKNGNQYYCLDFSPEEFERIVSVFGTTENVYRTYYQHLKQSILADLGNYKPRRIGHMTLVHKFQKRFPCKKSFSEEIIEILNLMQTNQLSLDYNGAGINKLLCLEPYPPEWIVQEAARRKIPLVYGSDAHTSRDLNQGYESLFKGVSLTSPTI